MRYAMVENGSVTNVIEMRSPGTGNFAAAVALGDRPVDVGDAYLDGKFWRNGVEILTPAEEIEQYKTALNTLGVVTDED